MRPLDREFDYYIKNQDELVKQYNGKYVAIVGEEVIGAYDSEEEAVVTTMKAHELGTFMVQLCEPGEDSYSATFHSRVSFA